MKKLSVGFISMLTVVFCFAGTLEAQKAKPNAMVGHNIQVGTGAVQTVHAEDGSLFWRFLALPVTDAAGQQAYDLYVVMETFDPPTGAPMVAFHFAAEKCDRIRGMFPDHRVRIERRTAGIAYLDDSTGLGDSGDWCFSVVTPR